jgi:hypothetical protein
MTERVTTTKVPSVAVEYTGDRQSIALQKNIASATAGARSALPNGEVVFEDVSFTANTNTVLEHKLNRAYSEWTVTRVRGTHPISIVEIAQNDADLDKRQLTLHANTACTAHVRVR